MKKIVFLLLLVPGLLAAQKASKNSNSPVITRLEPAFWWTGMVNPDVQLLVYGPGIGAARVSVDYPGVRVKETRTADSPNYLFVTLTLAPETRPGQVPLVFTVGKKQLNRAFELRARPRNPAAMTGLEPRDLIYLVMPDRFANGNPANDNVAGMREKADRQAPYGRHGGDLAGIQKHLDYIADLGTTALWINPVQENDQPGSSYHGYAITDLYQIDRRLGSNAEYVALVDSCRRRGIKVIMDLVHNHIGLHHWWMTDLPYRDWVHQFSEFTRSNYRATALMDPYASQIDTQLMADGWFDTSMPDLNQKNPQLATYLIQNTIWWIEYAGIEGVRMDTYPYPDRDFMANWSGAVLREYPKFGLVGEVWVPSVGVTAYFLQGTPNRDGFAGTLPGSTDFPLYGATLQALNEGGGWESGMARLYYTLGQDFLYQRPEKNVLFLDNHDLTRFYTSVGANLAKYKLGVAFLLTTRGIPQVYYGTELLMEGDGGQHSEVRKDVPGGWPGDPTSAFTAAGRTAAQNEAFTYLRTLAQWRKGNAAVHSGKLTHFVPDDNVYVYFRHTPTASVMVLLNGDDKAKTVTTARYAERLTGFSSARNVITGEMVKDLSTLALPARAALVLELGK